MRFRRIASLVCLLAAIVPTYVGLAATTVARAVAAIVPPLNPPASIPLSRALLAACDDVPATAPHCLHVALPAIDAARAAENVGPLILPGNFAALTVQEQVFVVTNLERVDRGLTPINGLSSTLDTDAQAGAAADTDPAFPPWTVAGGGNWAGSSNLWVADFGFMYDDGPGGYNVDCAAPGDSGCWEHRTNILSDYGAPALMGVGETTSGPFGGSVDQVFLGDDTHDRAYFAWSTGEGLLLDDN